MKDALLNKIQYLLSFKLNVEDERYIKLLENIFLEFLINIENIYNLEGIATNTYYNMLLNKLNMGIKSIIIPADVFYYHPLGFLEFGSKLKDDFDLYRNEGIEISKELKEKIVKKNYFYYILQVVKNNKKGIGFKRKIKNSEGKIVYRYESLENALNEYQATTLASFIETTKKSFKCIYPDGTTYEYFVYTKCFSVSDILCMNAVSMIERVFGASFLMNAELDSNTKIFENINQRYDHLLGRLQYDKFGNKIYTTVSLLDEFLYRIKNESSLYKKLEYFKKLNKFLFQLFEYKVMSTLSTSSDNVKKLVDDVKVMEEMMLYNATFSLHDSMEHVKLLKNIKMKLHEYINRDSKEINKKYVIYNKDRNNSLEVESSVEPIEMNDKYVLVQIIDVKKIQGKVLIKANFSIVDFKVHATKIYDNIYLSLTEFKNLFSSNDLGSKRISSDVIRSTIANRLLNPTIMDIIKKERHNFLGEFVYSQDDERCIIYKNRSIEELLEKVM